MDILKSFPHCFFFGGILFFYFSLLILLLEYLSLEKSSGAFRLLLSNGFLEEESYKNLIFCVGGTDARFALVDYLWT